jgi:hypothetical protein
MRDKIKDFLAARGMTEGDFGADGQFADFAKRYRFRSFGGKSPDTPIVVLIIGPARRDIPRLRWYGSSLLTHSDRSKLQTPA